MTLFETLIKGMGSLEKDVLKVCFQIIEMPGYMIIIYISLYYELYFLKSIL